MTVTRDWNSARRKAAEGCRVCGTWNADPAHLWPRSFGGDEHPDNIVGLCRRHHGAFDAGEFDLGPMLTPAERLKVHELAETKGRREGLHAAHMRLYPLAHPERRVAA